MRTGRRRPSNEKDKGKEGNKGLLRTYCVPGISPDHKIQEMGSVRGLRVLLAILTMSQQYCEEANQVQNEGGCKICSYQTLPGSFICPSTVLSQREQQAGFGVGSWEGLETCTVRASQPREQSPVTAPKSLQC